MEKIITAERSFELNFTEEDFPDWTAGTKISSPYDHVDGNRYVFSGIGVVDEIIHQVGAAVLVKVTHVPPASE